MAGKPNEKPEKDEPEVVAESDDVSDPVQENWEFLGRVPTRTDVEMLLKSLPPVWGVETVDFIDYVQALGQKKKTKVPHPDPERAERGVTVEQTIEAHVLYMSVAGRVKMLEAAAEENGWEVSFVPEPKTPTGTPGLLDDGRESQRIVYREYVRIVNHAGGIDKSWSMGSKPGMAWVRFSGGSAAAGSNPYEKVETSARGRAIAAWGFGVLPGSGIASLEEVLGAGANRAAMNAQDAEGQGRQGGGQPRESRADLIKRTMTVAEELRQERGIGEVESRQKMAEYLQNTFGIEDVWDAEAEQIRWADVLDGQILLLCNSLIAALKSLRDAGSNV